MPSIRNTAAVPLLVVVSGLASLAQTRTEALTYVHTGALLDRPGQAPRGASTIIVRGGRVDSVRDGHIAPQAGARLIDLSAFVLPG